jgi:ubiquinone/menaquinone biosynthesis C-methylase UbiE
MKNSEELKDIVKEKYGAIAEQSKEQNETSCCGVGSSCGEVDYTIFSDDYSNLEGYNKDADLGLGCGLPTEFAKMKAGDTVLDLGSGAGNDAFVARREVGESGKVIGLDMTEAMIAKARVNADKIGFNNVEFRLGDIEEMPIGGESIDVVVSNCVMNLVPDKDRAFQETFRVLKQNGHFSISDVVIKGELPEGLKDDAEMYAGCVSGAIEKDEYLATIKRAGFKDIQVQKEKAIQIPDETLKQYLSDAEITRMKSGEFGIFSITVFAEKPCCEPGAGCC